LKEVIKKGILHKGLSFIDVLQPCPTYNDINTKEWYQSYEIDASDSTKRIPKIYKLEDENYNGTVNNENESSYKIALALEKSREWENRIPVGVFYQNDKIITYGERIESRIENYFSSPPASQTVNDKDGNTIVDIDNLLDKLRTR